MSSIRITAADGLHITNFANVLSKLLDCRLMAIVAITGSGDGHYLHDIVDLSESPNA